MSNMNWPRYGNPYAPPYGASRNAKTSKDGSNGRSLRKQNYEDKMEKQRVAHVMYSGEAANSTKAKVN